MGVCDVRKKLRIAGIPARGFVLTTRSGPDAGPPTPPAVAPAEAPAVAPGIRVLTTTVRASTISARTPTIHQNAIMTGSPGRTVHRPFRSRRGFCGKGTSLGPLTHVSNDVISLHERQERLPGASRGLVHRTSSLGVVHRTHRPDLRP